VTVSPSRSIAAVVGLLVFSALSHADQPARSKTASKSPQHDELARLVGSWDAAVHLQINGKETIGKAKCEAKWILDENAVQQEYNSIFMGAPLTIMQLLTYDADKKKFVEIHMSNRGGGAMVNEGTSADGGKEFKFAGQHWDPREKKEVPIRTVYTFEDNDHFTLDWYMPGPDGKEIRQIHITHARRK